MTHPAEKLRKLRADLEAKKAENEADGNGQSGLAEVSDKAPPNDPATRKRTVSTDKTPKDSKKVSMKAAPKRVKVKSAPAKRRVAARDAASKSNGKPAAKKVAPAKKPAKAASESNGKAKAKPKPQTGSDRTFDRDKTDGLRPVERRVIKAIADKGDPTSIVGLAYRMFGKDCGTEGPESVRTIRNAARIPIRCDILESAGRGKLRVTTAYKRAKGNIEKLMKSYQARMKKAKKAAKVEA